jgi:hypothetical protein
VIPRWLRPHDSLGVHGHEKNKEINKDKGKHYNVGAARSLPSYASPAWKPTPISVSRVGFARYEPRKTFGRPSLGLTAKGERYAFRRFDQVISLLVVPVKESRMEET